MLFLTAVATLLIVYVIYAVAKGEIYGPGRVVREDSPRVFWKIVILYSLSGLILLTLA
ncbi:hypothetical protein [Marinimicrobium sp. ABcell2]|uniref:hypothetical protein n=1 Tax=Marinimicrobium sp. ABcell2 TaxID=3069751 RepID=UPI0027AEC65D|nr:hypothetical protein [Marinimicrobium sp. ABcell2]MDQ2076940.1 hypothetical protein [Marinimicrobium sp. ABcell2]